MDYKLSWYQQSFPDGTVRANFLTYDETGDLIGGKDIEIEETDEIRSLSSQLALAITASIQAKTNKVIKAEIVKKEKVNLAEAAYEAREAAKAEAEAAKTKTN